MLLELQVTSYKDEIAEISSGATYEALLEEMLKKVESTWDKTEFTVAQHKETSLVSDELFIITGVDEVIAILEDSQVQVTTMRGSRYIGPFKAVVENWDKTLQLLAETLEEWMVCQR